MAFTWPMSQIEVLDLGVLREMGVVSGVAPGPETEEIIAIFLREERPRLPQLEALFDQRSAADLERGAHSLAGSCAILGARQAQQVAIALEQAAKGADWNGVKALLAELREAWARLESALAAHRARQRA